MKNQVLASLVLTLAGFTNNIAFADTVSINQSFDLSAGAWSNTGTSVLVGAYFNPSSLIKVGDVVDLTFNFLPGQSLMLSSTGGSQRISPMLFQDSILSQPNTSNFSIINASMELIGLNGAFPVSVSIASQSSGSMQLGATFSGSFVGTGQSITFTGIHSRFDVAALQNNQSFYSRAVLNVSADGVAISPVPEPETYAMLLAGLGVIGLVRRRRTVATLKDDPRCQLPIWKQ